MLERKFLAHVWIRAADVEKNACDIVVAMDRTAPAGEQQRRAPVRLTGLRFYELRFDVRPRCEEDFNQGSFGEVSGED